MNRTNYGRRSGVIVDICSAHGVWFDDGELARILGWIREGHRTESERRRILEDAELEAARRSASAPARRTMTMPAYGGGPTALGRVLTSVIEVLFTR
jgi:Zn-finger nucleic acid-binding protein